ncbi:CDK-activating kinase assembly factor MAT1-domain-containing protein [Lipomyces tetrasporus]|uniref:RNA polymerase II transcription factor B subunit 3 n=1 Tax=Lipomyces tetrasporus TaxID=54092 RepID=A0AAD7VTT1_9ASCO|nr:CDK-activating kinase assembly factor MAT1-domain-containing protein [Lipomyces tetrasporus]KAJ8101049.1 CDK-activating kinase assembly factor MAT1-domain-containing protein [Lipomyces tetrasporus]
MDGVSRIEDEVCPVCKLDTYMNPSMRFLINTECYHKMCESCVDRIYSQGPAPCPYPNCGKTLRKNRFKRQLFSDVAVEREVDVRKRVAKVFNRRREEFASLSDYNDYLEEVETAIFNLVNKVDVEATEARLEAYEAANRQAIATNASLQTREAENAELLRNLEAERRRQQRAEALEESMAEQELKREVERKVIKELANAREGEAENAVRKAVAAAQKTVQLKKSSARRSARDTSTVSFEAAALSMINTKLATPDARDDLPYDTLEEEEYVNDLYTVGEHYYDPFLDNIENSQQAKAAGFGVRNVYEQLLFEAFMGLGCFIENEKVRHKGAVTT